MIEESREDEQTVVDSPEVDLAKDANEAQDSVLAQDPDDAPEDDAAKEADEAPEVDPAKEAAPAKPPKLSKADKLAARADQLRLRDARRAAERENAADSSARRPKAWIIATATVSVVALALATVLVIGFFSWHHQRQLNDARTASLKAAKAYAVAFGTYDYQHLDADFNKTSGLLTPAFAKSYKSTSAALAKTFVAYKTKVTASVPEAAVISASTSDAQVLVLLDQVITSSQSATPKINRNRLKVSLIHSGGKWLVNRTDAT